jgi:tetratricopeptide (TPR) repeat protein
MTIAKPLRLAAVPFAIFICALAIRLLFLLEFSASPFSAYLGLDTHEYDELAKNILAGSWSGDQPFVRPPLYPLFLAFLYKTIGAGFFALRSAHALLSAANCVLAYLIAKTMFRRQLIALLTALFCCFSGTLVFLDLQLLPTALDGFLQLLIVLVLLHAGRRHGLSWWACAGLLIGLSAINRGAALFFIPVAVLWAYGVMRWGWATDGERAAGESPYATAKVIGALLLAAMAPILPVAMHNARYDILPVPRLFASEVPASTTLGRLATLQFVPIASNAGINFYLGNHWDLREINDPNHPQHFETYDQIQFAVNKEHIFSLAEGNRYLVGETLQGIRARPADGLKLLGLKASQLLNGAEIARNSNLYAHRRDSVVLSALLWKWGIAFPSGLLIPLALLGLWFDRARWRSRLPLLGSLLVLSLFILIFFVTARYRAPMLPILAMYAACALTMLGAWIRERRWTRLCSALVALLALTLACNLPVVKINAFPGEYEYSNLGFILLQGGKTEEAISHLEWALRTYPDSAQLRGVLVLAYKSQGRFDEALRLFDEALRRNPRHAATYNDLALTQLQLGRLDQAESAFREALRLKPDVAEVRANFGSLLAKQGHNQEAIAEYLRALDSDPRCALAYSNLGVVLENMGHWDQAIAAYEDLLIVDPNNEMAPVRLAIVRTRRAAAQANSGQ